MLGARATAGSPPPLASTPHEEVVRPHCEQRRLLDPARRGRLLVVVIVVTRRADVIRRGLEPQMKKFWNHSKDVPQ